MRISGCPITKHALGRCSTDHGSRAIRSPAMLSAHDALLALQQDEGAACIRPSDGDAACSDGVFLASPRTPHAGQ